MSNKYNCIFTLPPDIPNIDYDQITVANQSYKDILEHLSNIDKYQKELVKLENKIKSKDQTDSDTQKHIQLLESPENNVEYARLIPPYNSPCAYSDEGCLKKAAFKNMSNMKLLCWFHINCQNNN